MKCHHLMGKALTDVPSIFTRKQSSLDPVSQLVTDYLFILFPLIYKQMIAKMTSCVHQKH